MSDSECDSVALSCAPSVSSVASSCAANFPDTHSDLSVLLARECARPLDPWALPDKTHRRAPIGMCALPAVVDDLSCASTSTTDRDEWPEDTEFEKQVKEREKRWNERYDGMDYFTWRERWISEKTNSTQS